MGNLAQRKQEIEDRIRLAQQEGEFTHPVTLIAVTKYQTTALANEAIRCGIADIGENHVQEILRKSEDGLLPCRKHFIGHLQTNKVRALLSAKDLALIQSVDSERLLFEINKYAKEPVNVLIQVNIAGEEQKFGVSFSQTLPLVRAAASCENVRVKGYMAIMPICTKEDYYRRMYDLYRETDAAKIPGVEMQWLSMGMSGDFELAVKNGANMVRVGSYLFA